MKAGEVIGTGVWAASAVAVTGYTFKAYKATYSEFPTPGGGGTGAVSKPDAKTARADRSFDKAVSKIPVIGKPWVAAANWAQNAVGKILHGFTYDSPSDIARLSDLPAPPASMRSTLRTAFQNWSKLPTSGRLTAAQQAQNARYEAIFSNANKWLKARGYTDKDVANLMKYWGIPVFQ